jgi:Uracil DNA glycosylase superfamily
MSVSSSPMKELALLELAKKIRSRKNWWLFPSEGSVKGFLGTAPIFIVGDQPSTDEWSQEHPHRKLFYETLRNLGLANAHLTDLYKKRGLSNSLKQEIPSDFQNHVNLFRNEMEIIRPKLIVALGQLAQRLLIQNLKEWHLAIPRIWHFSYVVRMGKQSQYEANMREMIFQKL